MMMLSTVMVTCAGACFVVSIPKLDVPYSQALYFSSLSVKIPTFIRHCDQVAMRGGSESQDPFINFSP